jgi:CheY-like chemotaxis protein
MTDTPVTTAPKPKALIIEDNAVNAKLLTIYLEGAGFEVLHAVDGYTGLQMAKTQTGISIILLDRIMPDMDGLDVLRDLKLGPKSWGIPVIMLTAALSTQQIDAAKLVGAYACLPKPYNKDKIIETINEALKSRRKP